MIKTQHTLLYLAVAFAFPALAQTADNDSPAVEEVLVTGFRQSLATALDNKRDATGSVDAIMAEDIADFPDNNLAESLQRIPGVAITRAAGEGRQISVRGLGPEFTRVRINGMESIATSGGTDAIGGANRGRGFDFNTFSSDLFSSLIVRKTASADIEEGSLGATVDLNTAKPFDYDEFVAVANVQAGYNDLSEKTDPKVSFLVSNVFNDFVGGLLSVSYSERQIIDKGASTVRWDNTNDFANCTATDCDLAEFNDAFRPRLPRYDSYAHEMERLGLSGALQFRPSDATDVNLNVLYSKNDSTRNEVFMQTVLNSNPIVGAMTITDYEIDDSNTVSYASFDNATVRAENRYDELSTEFTQFTLSATHDISESLRVSGLVGSAESKFDNPVQTTVVMEKSGLDFSYDYRGDRRENPYLTFGDTGSSDPLAQLNSVQGWATNSVRLRPLSATNKFDVIQADIEFDLNDSITLKGGIHFKAFDFETFEARRDAENVGGVVIDANNTMAFSPGVGPQSDWLVPDIAAIAEQYDIYANSGEFAVSAENRLVDNYSAEEETLGVYAQLAFNTELAGTPVRGDLGLRYVDTDQSSTAWATAVGASRQVTAEHSYDDVLPAINLVFEPIEDVLIRMGYAEVMARAGLQSIRPNASVSVSGTNRTVNRGNPTLEPTKAKTYDVGVEIYFDNEGAFSSALFKKDIDSFVQNLVQTRTFTETGLPVAVAVNACDAGPDGYGPSCNENLEWNTNTPLNGPGGDLYGFELSYQQPLTFLDGFWSNFGVIGTFTYVKAQLDYVDTTGTVLATRDLEGLSESTKSATLYYEQDNFSARISSVTRSSYLTSAIGRNNNDMEGTNPTTNLDASISYNIDEHWKVSFEALNLTDEVDDQWVDSSGNRLSYYHETGKQFYLGVQYKF